MEKKWQAMLHEAADASFQKEIEVLAVMDSAAYSYVDLPQTALCTLSEKILLLPHQVIVLLFSRYCFYLSPEDTEKFFQIDIGFHRHYVEEVPHPTGEVRYQIVLFQSKAIRHKLTQGGRCKELAVFQLFFCLTVCMVAPIVLPGKPVQASIPCITLKNILLRDTIRFAAVVVDQVQELFVNCSATALGDRFCRGCILHDDTSA